MVAAAVAERFSQAMLRAKRILDLDTSPTFHQYQSRSGVAGLVAKILAVVTANS